MLLQNNLCGLQPQTYNALHAFAGGPASEEFEPCANGGDCETCPMKEYQSRAAVPSVGDSVYVREGWRDGSPYSMNRLSQGWRSTAYWGYDWKDLATHPEWKPAEFGVDEDSRWVLMRKGGQK